MTLQLYTMRLSIQLFYNGPRDARYNLFQYTSKTLKRARSLLLLKNKIFIHVQNSNKTQKKTQNK